MSGSPTQRDRPRIYLDHNATTPLRPEVREVLLGLMSEPLANASSIHTQGRRARALVDDARWRVAEALGVLEEEVFFTSGGTESNNLVLFGSLAASPRRLVSSRLEHPAVLEPVRALEASGVDVGWVRHEFDGSIDPESVDEAVGDGPALVSLMGANNEIGSVSDIAAIRASLASSSDVLMHCDAVQCLGKLDVSSIVSSCDFVSLSAHKVGGPVGVGVLVKRKGRALLPRNLGGAQEAAIRPGTENVAGIVAASHAILLAVQEAADFQHRLRPITAEFWRLLRDCVPDVHLNGPGIDDPNRLANTLNVSFSRHGDARMLVTRFDLAGLEVSSGSACASGSLEPSHVIAGLSDDDARVRSAIRFSLGLQTSLADARRAVETLGIILGEVS